MDRRSRVWQHPQNSIKPLKSQEKQKESPEKHATCLVTSLPTALPQGAKGEQMRRNRFLCNPRVNGVRSVGGGIVCTEGGLG
ncbi:hypothetical protein AVEN_41220-1 [Araneus ventricosus]|uniref:Uncharacterized protein n=1 Tax=Araneus ventricosus TaxID=182803 RepID=A0A4Y2VZU0_ARAVE|nr:hypothetical protein AVEN_41220-1 [Araneus ventricosus]